MENTNKHTTPEELIAMADQGIEDMVSANNIAPIIGAMSSHGKYSLRNLMLILLQNPNATRVAGMRMWNYNSRSVIPNSKSIKILAPVFKGPTSADGTPTNKTEQATGYKVTYVFDISQTQGKEMANTKCSSEDLAKYSSGLIEVLTALSPKYTFSIAQSITHIDHVQKQVSIASSITGIDALAHLISYTSEIHALNNTNISHSDESSTSAQHFASSAVTHIVMNNLGLAKTNANELDYSALIDKDTQEITNCLHYVRKLSQLMINSITQYLSEQNLAQVKAPIEATKYRESPTLSPKHAEMCL